MDQKERFKKLTEYFATIMDISEPELSKWQFELNGWEGLLAWNPNKPLFYQMSYKSHETWTIAVFPSDIYGKKMWISHYDDGLGVWEEKDA